MSSAHERWPGAEGGQVQPGHGHSATGADHGQAGYPPAPPPGSAGQQSYPTSPPPGSAGQAPTGSGYGASPTQPAGAGPGYSPPPPPRGRAVAWVIVGLIVAMVVALVLVVVGLAVFSADPDPEDPPPPGATEPEDPAPPTAGDDAEDDAQHPADEETTDEATGDGNEELTEDEATDDGDPDAGDEPPRADPGGNDLAPVAEADVLPSEDAERLDEVIDIRTSDLRYNEGEVFGSYFYRCLFDAHLENVTDVTQEFEMEFAVPQVPDRTWSGNPTTLEPGERSQIIAGWETTSLDELGITEDECTGPVELTILTADPG